MVVYRALAQRILWGGEDYFLGIELNFSAGKNIHPLRLGTRVSNFDKWQTDHVLLERKVWRDVDRYGLSLCCGIFCMNISTTTYRVKPRQRTNLELYVTSFPGRLNHCEPSISLK